MGRKKTCTSWLRLVKRVFFRCPTHDDEEDGKVISTREEHEQQKDKERMKRRWVFQKHASLEVGQCEEAKLTESAAAAATTAKNSVKDCEEEGQTFAVTAAATAGKAAAVHLITTRPPASNNVITQHYAAIVIQKAFRDYLSRRDGSCFVKGGKMTAAFRREKALACAFSNQFWRAGNTHVLEIKRSYRKKQDGLINGLQPSNGSTTAEELQ